MQNNPNFALTKYSKEEFWEITRRDITESQ